MEILVDGSPLPEYRGGGRSYVEALRGRDYSIRVTNRTGERIAVALAVDGLNTIDARTTRARDGSKWIIEPWDSVTIDGWQTSGSTARRFFFTTEERSYGAWLGRTKNLGVITAAVFRERRPEPPRPHRRWWPFGDRDDCGGCDRKGDAGAPMPSNEAQESARGEGKLERSAGEAAPPQRLRAKDQSLSDDYAATGIGREVDHDVTRVEFLAESSPAATLELRYEYHETLVRLGVLPRPHRPYGDGLDRREHARGFSDSDFAPDPYRSGRR